MSVSKPASTGPVRGWRPWASGVLVAALTACSGAPAGTPSRSPAASVDSGRLETLLFAFAADSMGGRTAGTEGHQRATRFLSGKAQEYGLQPAGIDGTYFQDVPLRVREPFSNLTTTDGPIAVGFDFAPLLVEDFNSPTSKVFTGLPVVYGGDMAGPNEITAEEAVGKVVVLGAVQTPNGRAFGLAGATLEKLAGAQAILMASTDYASTELMEFLLDPQTILEDGTGTSAGGDGPFLAFVSEAFVQRLFGTDVDDLATGAAGPELTGDVGARERPTAAPSRNVVAKVEGSDPSLRSEYVVVSAHSDHIAPQTPAVDHDSLRAHLAVIRPAGAETPDREPTAEEAARIAEILAATNGHAPRLDSISNGADDDGSGSVALLEIARVLAASPIKPKRSILFVWHTAEEAGLFGSKYFTDHPTVPRDALVADINVDMIGRGGADDVEGGGPGYLQLIGSRRLSTELGDIVEAVNTEERHGFTFDYQYDADGHPSNFYCRSDHYMYARYGIPIVFMSTGSHRDYHQRTDEPQYIDYTKLGHVADFVVGVAERVADLDHRVVVDKPKPDPNAPCQQ